MSDTIADVQHYLDDLHQHRRESSAEPLVRELLTRACSRLRRLCLAQLTNQFPRLTQPPLNLSVDELLGAAVERLILALREVRPQSPKHFFALANKHIEWELMDLARSIDQRPKTSDIAEIPAPSDSDPELTSKALRILSAIEQLPEPERSAFELVRIQGLTYREAAALEGVTEKTISRRKERAILQLAASLSDLMPEE